MRSYEVLHASFFLEKISAQLLVGFRLQFLGAAIEVATRLKSPEP
jgi:hypothetical protein